METVVIDTDVIINYSRGYDTKLQKLLKLQDKHEMELVVSSLVVFEFYSGTSLINPSLLAIADLLFSKFRVQEVNAEIAKMASGFNRERKLQQKIEAVDLLIGATCISLNAKLFTLNKKHFKIIPHLKFY